MVNNNILTFCNTLFKIVRKMGRNSSKLNDASGGYLWDQPINNAIIDTLPPGLNIQVIHLLAGVNDSNSPN